jgi:hypothetical protein
MGIDCGGLLRRFDNISPGKLVKKCFSNACSSVLRTGENKVACTYSTILATLTRPIWLVYPLGAGVIYDIPHAGCTVAVAS